jgi:hypothetical protein
MAGTAPQPREQAAKRGRDELEQQVLALARGAHHRGAHARPRERPECVCSRARFVLWQKLSAAAVVTGKINLVDLAGSENNKVRVVDNGGGEVRR